MTAFTASREAHAVVDAPREAIWAVLTDPPRLASLVPFLRTIEAVDEHHWRWEMSGLKVAGLDIAPTFTERMELTPPERLEFHHEPPAGVTERAGVTGWYELTALEPAADGTERTALATGLDITVELPLPGLARRTVETTMRGVIAQMGDRFAANLLRELGLPPGSAA
ncbi:SRPBCC family protein [Nocardioides sp. TRM66260-LWL]|uniref:CoxG family protein n=1 Tax=Nocardioides sp. TRM66260-LWL TaxID=2874478 RepID=UPI001CC3C77A|nr:SRPBCC family protein [Nocardioides sp. TRM66260-LWL]MBZ5735497.1 SRPBCC family protein [Nocardioides sp. TRM66260-LWL]